MKNTKQNKRGNTELLIAKHKQQRIRRLLSLLSLLSLLLLEVAQNVATLYGFVSLGKSSVTRKEF